MSNDIILNAFRSLGANITSDAEFEVPSSSDMTIKGTVFKSYHPDIPDGNMTKVIVPDGIEVIDEQAFMGPNQSHNYYLECCRLPEGVTTIRKEAFALCASMNEIELPSTLKKIESGAFMYSGLRKISLPEGLEVIGNGAFQNCRLIREFRIPSTVVKIGKYCFSQMGVPLMGMDQPGAKIIAPSHLKEIYDKEYLDDLFEQHEVEWYKSKTPSVSSANFDYCCIIKATADGKVDFAKTEESIITPAILLYQFGRVMSFLEDLNIDKKLIAQKLIDAYNSDGDSDLFSFESPDNCMEIAVFVNSDGESRLIVQDASKACGNEIFLIINACAKLLTNVEIFDDNIVQIIIALYCAAEDYDGFVSNLRETFEDLDEEDADNHNSNSKKSSNKTESAQSYPKTFTIRGNKLIKYTGKGYSVDVPDCVEIIGAGAFAGNNDYHDIRIRDGVKRIESRALAGLSRYKEVYIAQSVEFIDENAFGDITAENMNDGPTVFAVSGSYAFNRAKALNVRVKECKPISVAKKRHKDKIVKELNITESTSEISQKYFDKFKKVETPSSRRKMYDKNAARSADKDAVGCDIMFVNLYELAEKYDKDTAHKARVIADYYSLHGIEKNEYNSVSDEEYSNFISDAIRFAQYFKTDDFNSKSDIFTEISKGYIKHISMMHHFLSFVYVANEYCKKESKKYDQLSLEEIIAVSDFIDSCGGTNYKAGNVRLTGFDEKNYYFYDNSLSNYLIAKSGIGFKADYDHCTQLGFLKKELISLNAPVSQIFDYLSEGHYSQTLADILSVWCTYSLASTAPFAVIGGLKDYDLEPCEEINIKERESLASEVIEKDEIVYFEDVLIRYNGTSKVLRIPEGISVTPNREWIRDVTITDSLIFPSNVNVYPGKNRFCIPSEIKNIEFTSNTLIIEDEAFNSMRLKKVILPEGTKSIGSKAFYYCGSREEKLVMKIPYSVESLKDDSFTYSTIELIVYHDSYAEKFFKNYNGKCADYCKFKYSVEYTENQKAQMRRAEEERKRQKELMERRRKEEEERRKAEEARIAAQRKQEYCILEKEKENLLKTIAENKGLFGEKARKRKEAKAKLAEVEEKMSKYPEFNK